MRLSVFLLFFACMGAPGKMIDWRKVSDIEIGNKTNNHLISINLILTDSNSILGIVREINNLQSVDPVSVKSNFGYFDLYLHMKDKSISHWMVFYTTYNGVIILGSDSREILMNQYYKNDNLELVILSIFIQKSSDKKSAFK